jgi:hypothetical protein
VDIPGLTESEARQLEEWVEGKNFGWFGSASTVDPTVFLTLHLDRDSAQMVYDGLMRNPATATPEDGLAGDIGKWLRASSKSE